MMNKDRRKMTEKILNYALEIIFVLTGEEYTIVKKNSPHCSIDQLSGEVPIKCDNVAVYFSMEEWEYIEGHKELYEDMLMGSHQACKTVKTPSNDSGFHDTSARAAKADSRNKMDIQMVETHADTSADENIADIVSNVDQTEEQSTRSHPKNEENVFENVCTVSSRCDEKLDTVWISDGEEDKCENNVQPEEVHPHSCTDGAIGLNMFCEPAVWDSSEDVVEDDTGLCNKDQGEDLEINPTIELNIRNEVNLPSTSTSYQCTQTPCPQNENFVTDYSGATVGIWEVKKEEDTDCSKLTSRTSVCEDHQAPSTHEKHCTSNKNRKRVSSGSKLHVDKTPQTGEAPFQCSECGRQFAYISHFISHKKSHMKGKPFVCLQCGKSFSQRSNLVSHHRIHTGEKPYICPACGKGFSERSNVVAHHRTHTGEKPYVCPDCGKCFTQRSVLGRHLKTHSGEKPYVCSVCRKRFTQRSHLLSHQRIHIGTNTYCNE